MKFSLIPNNNSPADADSLVAVTAAGVDSRFTLANILAWLVAKTGWITAANILYGKLRKRQGGSATNWGTTGTNSYDYSAVDVFTQAGSIALTNGAGITVTFPQAFNQVPIVVASVSSANAANGFVVVKSITATTFLIYHINTAGSATTSETANWIAIGQ